jgi:hypothetical protein
LGGPEEKRGVDHRKATDVNNLRILRGKTNDIIEDRVKQKKKKKKRERKRMGIVTGLSRKPGYAVAHEKKNALRYGIRRTK